MNTFKNISNLLIPFSKRFQRNRYLSDDNLPYYKFSHEDYERLLNPFSFDTDLVFSNSENEEIKFQLVKSTLGKKVFKNFGFKKCFFYDEQEIQFKVSKNENSNLSYNLKKFLISSSKCEEKSIYSSNSKFIATIDFDFKNYKNTFVVDYQKPISTIIINGKVYTNLLVLESGNTIYDQIKTLTKIYFDIKKGIIGFDDFFGKEWRLVD